MPQANGDNKTYESIVERHVGGWSVFWASSGWTSTKASKRWDERVFAIRLKIIEILTWVIRVNLIGMSICLELLLRSKDESREESEVWLLELFLCSLKPEEAAKDVKNFLYVITRSHSREEHVSLHCLPAQPSTSTGKHHTSHTQSKSKQYHCLLDKRRWRWLYVPPLWCLN